MERNILLHRLRPFRRRVRWVLAARYAAVGGAIGAALALFADVGDWLGKWTVEPITLVGLIAAGVLVGTFYAAFRPVSERAIAQLIDERAHLKDRVATALLCDDSLFSDAVREDAVTHLVSLRPKELFRFRWTHWHSALALLLLALLVSRFLPDLPLPFLASFRQDRKEAREVTEEVQRVLKPILEHAERPEARRLEKALAQQWRELYRRAQKGRLSKKEALMKAEKLLAQAEQLQRQSQQQLRRVSTKAITAAETLKEQLKRQALASQMREARALLERLQEIERQLQSQNLSPTQRQLLESEKRLLQRTLSAMGQTDERTLQSLMQALQGQQALLQQMLQSGRDPRGRPLTEVERELLQQQLQSLQQQLRALRLSKQAQEFLRKLMNDPNFQEAMRLLAELQKQLGQLQQGQIPQLSPEELERMLRELEQALEELAKLYGDDEKIRELARELLEQAKRLKEGGT